MKLKDLLTVVPKDYEIGLAGFDNDIYTITYGIKEDVIYSFALKYKMTYGQVEDMNVISIYPCANVCCNESHMYLNDITPLHVKTHMLIKIQ